jgi:hypothetical protein
MLLQPGADDRAGPKDLYQFGPGLIVSVRGERRARNYFHEEYAAAALATNSVVPMLEATIRARMHRGPGGVAPDEPELRGTHKLARWRASVPLRCDADTLSVAVDVRGPLGLALVQSYVIEPLMSLAAIRAGSVLLPGAAIARGGDALLLIGRSRSGKSSLAARALAAGLHVLGDDQVVIDVRGECRPFPRRLRLYPDVALTAPAAFAALPPSVRRRLTALRRVNALTRGYVAPPVSVSPSSLAADANGGAPIGLGEVVVIHRAPVDDLTFECLDRGEVEAEAEDVLRAQRSKIFSVAGVPAAYESLLAQERAIVSRALSAAPARRVLVPTAWPAERAVGALARELELQR